MVEKNIISINDLRRKKDAIEYANKKGLNPEKYKDFVKAMEALMFIESLELKYVCKF